jgi:hypothetical protein
MEAQVVLLWNLRRSYKMTNYEIYKNSFNDDVIKKTDKDGKVSFIPLDPANSDYQRYLNPEQDEATLEIK